LGLGSMESLLSTHKNKYEDFNPPERIFRKVCS